MNQRTSVRPSVSIPFTAGGTVGSNSFLEMDQKDAAFREANHTQQRQNYREDRRPDFYCYQTSQKMRNCGESMSSAQFFGRRFDGEYRRPVDMKEKQQRTINLDGLLGINMEQFMEFLEAVSIATSGHPYFPNRTL
uniref:Uncharacterized protein n=1 Tax=Globodera rostochiensis TaxID=31243 RepID=A0A914HIV4_GLORO